MMPGGAYNACIDVVRTAKLSIAVDELWRRTILPWRLPDLETCLRAAIGKILYGSLSCRVMFLRSTRVTANVLQDPDERRATDLMSRVSQNTEVKECIVRNVVHSDV
jgi:hypothetical protein